MKEKKEKNSSKSSAPKQVPPESIASTSDLKNFLEGVRDRMSEGGAAPIYALSSMNFVLNLPNIYQLLDPSNKEIARDIWLRIKQAGMQLKNPAMLFSEEEITSNLGGNGVTIARSDRTTA